MNAYIDLIINLAATFIIQSVKNPTSMARLQPVLFKIAAVIYASAQQMNRTAELDAKIDSEFAKLQSAPATHE